MTLSIITVNRNNALGLEKTICSVGQQTFTDFEYLVIDGNSTDDSIMCIKNHSDIITFWISEPDTGIYNAMNKGWMKASGKYCLFLNSGDIFDSANSLESFFSHSFSEDIVFGDLSFSDDNTNAGSCVYPDILDFDYLYHYSLPHPSTLTTRSLLEKLGGYNENYRYVSDWIFFIDAIFLHNSSYRHIPVLLSSFDVGGVSNSPNNQGQIISERKKHLCDFYKNLSLATDEQDRNELLYYVKKHRKSKILLICVRIHKILLNMRSLLQRTKT